MGSAMNYSERPYENQMNSGVVLSLLQASHCQTNSYPSYQPPFSLPPPPRLPHPPMHTSTGPTRCMAPWATAAPINWGPTARPLHVTPLCLPESRLVRGRPPPSMYSSSNARVMQQMKAAWGGENNNSNSSNDIMQYSQPSPRPMMPPPPSMHSPPHSGMGGAAPGPPPHYRQILSSPHSWSQSQIPSPGGGVLHSPRTTLRPYLLIPHDRHLSAHP
ncbi:hypothetical protein CEXT_42391 [Caerostris extrusa]|uniref:Uncharacterized protein n=1 Tax=Caerostris extrusa TaxID=172846 RepID=A0AAV4M906_CAEEX|nr:hypothetical protein CEXT_42391 [Caerostris extrusa]